MSRPVKCLNEYRVEGRFSYTDYDGGPELCEKVDKRVDAHSEKEAADLLITDYKEEWPDACWLFGHPSVRYLQSVIERDYSLSSYWTRNPAEQKTLREVVLCAGSVGS
ncbi:hypothetical protein C5B42_01360 [Candidatus Cerribacteria bacterium 'Amazon FNV 2010 28 9']|uniref:Uncharacterized protein n=1 Tax=Candidatus Cerribacteria bacterium 'Amazon FNV 2010 28 9' TaxID=2081795 RepID=A0A317JSA9_9BACT|nr:MAG: hypothetical protein C5B42_01360 [Candidatus Cerribacteria bacterium 'Amazon FNV 2010 28 9']